MLALTLVLVQIVAQTKHYHGSPANYSHSLHSFNHTTHSCTLIYSSCRTNNICNINIIFYFIISKHSQYQLSSHNNSVATFVINIFFSFHLGTQFKRVNRLRLQKVLQKAEGEVLNSIINVDFSKNKWMFLKLKSIKQDLMCF